MKVLIIDDEEDMRRILALALGKVGKMEIIPASGGLEGLRKAEQEKPDAILLDVMMPIMDGLITLTALRKNPATEKIPVIFLTAKALPSELERLKNLGAHGILKKPFNPMTLASELQNLLEKK